MRVLAQSCYAKYANKIGRKFESPENGYVGEYLDDIVEKIIEIIKKPHIIINLKLDYFTKVRKYML